MTRLTEPESAALRAGLRSAWALAVVVVVSGVVFDLPALVAAGLLVGALALAREAWRRRGLRGFEYRRELSTRHAVWGDTVGVTVSIWNRSWLPVAWLGADDLVSEPVTLEGHDTVRGDAGGSSWLRDTWSLWPFERVERRYQLLADRRCRIAFGPVHLEHADLFAGTAASGDLPTHAELTIAPRSLPVHLAAPRSRWSARQRAVAGVPEDPAHFAGVRPYLPGDTPRRIHWRATARTGSPRSKRFDTSRERELLVAVDIQTGPGRGIGGGHDPDLVEALCVAAASLLRDGIASGARCGLVAAAYSYRPHAEVRVLPGSGPRQLLVLMDALARLSPYPSGPFATLLAALPRWLPLHTQLIIVTGREPGDYLPVLRRLRSLGYDLRLVAIGPDATPAAARARDAGVAAVTGELSPDWRTADALALAG